MPRPATIAALAMLPCITHAGPLTPPPGPPTSTDTALRQTDPRIPIGPDTTPGDADSVYRITAPGSYYLTENLTARASRHGIEIASNAVTIDLNGFSLLGLVFPPGQSLNGITVDGTRTNITIRNGHVLAWGSNGIDLGDASSVLIENVTAESNLGNGINANRAVVTQCVARANAASGFAGNGLAVDCVAVENGIRGFTWTGTISTCLAADNDGDGFSIFGAIDRSTARTNSDDGFVVFGGSIESCLAEFNSGDGVVVITDARVFGNTARQNTQNGFVISASNAFTAGNTSISNTGIGFLVLGSDTLTIRNVAGDNGGAAFSYGSNVTRGTTLFLTASGIVTSSDNLANLAY